jgi:predicted DCC family thiol-disulfide oxidoreductase YuxK
MDESTQRPAVFYDGACPICRREVAHYRTRAGAKGIDWVDVATCPPEALAPGLTREAALARMHVRGADGRMESGARAFAALWRALPGWSWLGRIVGAWPVAPLAELGYRGFLLVRRAWR